MVLVGVRRSSALLMHLHIKAPLRKCGCGCQASWAGAGNDDQRGHRALATRPPAQLSEIR